MLHNLQNISFTNALEFDHMAHNLEDKFRIVSDIVLYSKSIIVITVMNSSILIMSINCVILMGAIFDYLYIFCDFYVILVYFLLFLIFNFCTSIYVTEMEIPRESRDTCFIRINSISKLSNNLDMYFCHCAHCLRSYHDKLSSFEQGRCRFICLCL